MWWSPGALILHGDPHFNARNPGVLKPFGTPKYDPSPRGHIHTTSGCSYPISFPRTGRRETLGTRLVHTRITKPNACWAAAQSKVGKILSARYELIPFICKQVFFSIESVKKGDLFFGNKRRCFRADKWAPNRRLWKKGNIQSPDLIASNDISSPNQTKWWFLHP